MLDNLALACMMISIPNMAQSGRKGDAMDEVVKYLKALVFLQVNSITGEVAGKPEVLLYRAGLSVKEISGILGKSEAAIAKSLTRFKAGKSKEATSG